MRPVADTAHHPEDQTTPGVTVLRVESGVFFGNADHVRAAIENPATADGITAVVLDCETMPFVDVTAARMLSQLTADLHRQRVRLVLASEIGQVRDMIAAISDHRQTPGYHRTVAEAIRAAQTKPVSKPAEEQ